MLIWRYHQASSRFFFVNFSVLRGHRRGSPVAATAVRRSLPSYGDGGGPVVHLARLFGLGAMNPEGR